MGGDPAVNILGRFIIGFQLCMILILGAQWISQADHQKQVRVFFAEQCRINIKVMLQQMPEDFGNMIENSHINFPP